MPENRPNTSDPDPGPGRPRLCLGCRAKHPHAVGPWRGLCGVCVAGAKRRGADAKALAKSRAERRSRFAKALATDPEYRSGIRVCRLPEEWR